MKKYNTYCKSTISHILYITPNLPISKKNENTGAIFLLKEKQSLASRKMEKLGKSLNFADEFLRFLETA